MADVEKRLLEIVLTQTKASIISGPDTTQKNETVVKVDFLVIGIGLWTMKRGGIDDPTMSLMRLRNFKNGLPRIIQVCPGQSKNKFKS